MIPGQITGNSEVVGQFRVADNTFAILERSDAALFLHCRSHEELPQRLWAGGPLLLRSGRPCPGPVAAYGILADRFIDKLTVQAVRF